MIEPSFGLGRIIYAILEHAYTIRDVEKREQEKRDGEKRAYISLPPIIAPIKACYNYLFIFLFLMNLGVRTSSCAIR